MKNLLAAAFTLVATSVTSDAKALKELSENEEFKKSVAGILPELAQTLIDANLPACVKTVQEGIESMTKSLKVIGVAWKEGEKVADKMMEVAFGDKEEEKAA